MRAALPRRTVAGRQRDFNDAELLDVIRGLAAEYPCESHVVMFYYQGLETVDVQGNLFENQLQCDDLTGILGDVLGAQILLFDVTRTPARPVAAAEDRVAGAS